MIYYVPLVGFVVGFIQHQKAWRRHSQACRDYKAGRVPRATTWAALDATFDASINATIGAVSTFALLFVAYVWANVLLR